MFDSGVIVSSSSGCFFSLSGKLSALASPDMKEESRLWHCSRCSNPCIIRALSEKLHFPRLPLIRPEGPLFLFFPVVFLEEQGRAFVAVREEIQFGSGGSLSGSSGKCRRSDSVCLPDYLKVTLFQRANRRTLFSLGLYSLLCPCHKLRSDTVEAFHHLTGQ